MVYDAEGVEAWNALETRKLCLRCSFFFFFFKGKNITAMIGHDWFDERSLNVCIKLLDKALERCGTLFSKCKNVERNII